MRRWGILPVAVLAFSACAERARYPKIDCGLPPVGPEAGQCTEDSKVAAAVREATLAASVTALQEAQVADAIRASPTEGPCPYGIHRCYGWAYDRRGDSADPAPSIDPGDVPAIRDYTRRFINGLRAQKGIDAVAPDAELDDFAQRRAERYRHDHYDLPRIACASRCADLYGPGEGMWPMPVDQQVDTILSVMLRGGPGQSEHDQLLSPDWHRAGVGIVNPGGELYFVVVLAD